VKQEYIPLQRPLRNTTPETIETIDLTGSPEPPSKQGRRQLCGIPTPPSSLPSKIQQGVEIASNKGQHMPIASSVRTAHVAEHSKETVPHKHIESYQTLQDFYSLLDKIERTSYVGALFLEAYAEKLRDDMCKSCWFKHNVNVDLF
jgi:hypothetical protein